MVVAMFAMLTVDVAIDDVIDMTLMRNRHVLAADAVFVIPRVGIAAMARIARFHVARAEFVFVEVIAVRMVQMAVVRVVDVVVMADCRVATSDAVDVFVPIMNVFFCVHVHRLTAPSPACCNPLRIRSATCASASV